MFLTFESRVASVFLAETGKLSLVVDMATFYGRSIDKLADDVC